MDKADIVITAKRKELCNAHPLKRQAMYSYLRPFTALPPDPTIFQFQFQFQFVSNLRVVVVGG